MGNGVSISADDFETFDLSQFLIKSPKTDAMMAASKAELDKTLFIFQQQIVPHATKLLEAHGMASMAGKWVESFYNSVMEIKFIPLSSIGAEDRDKFPDDVTHLAVGSYSGGAGTLKGIVEDDGRSIRATWTEQGQTGMCTLSLRNVPGNLGPQSMQPEATAAGGRSVFWSGPFFHNGQHMGTWWGRSPAIEVDSGGEATTGEVAGASAKPDPAPVHERMFFPAPLLDRLSEHPGVADKAGVAEIYSALTADVYKSRVELTAVYNRLNDTAISATDLDKALADSDSLSALGSIPVSKFKGLVNIVEDFDTESIDVTLTDMFDTNPAGYAEGETDVPDSLSLPQYFTAMVLMATSFVVMSRGMAEHVPTADHVTEMLKAIAQTTSDAPAEVTAELTRLKTEMEAHAAKAEASLSKQKMDNKARMQERLHKRKQKKHEKTMEFVD